MDTKLRRIADYLSSRHAPRDIDPLAIAPELLPHFFILDVRQTPTDDGSRLHIRLVGTALDNAFGRSVKGHFLEEFLHGPRSADVLTGFYRCARNHQPIWMRQVVQIANKAPRFVEGVAFPVTVERIYGGLVVGEVSDSRAIGFESHPL